MLLLKMALQPGMIAIIGFVHCFKTSISKFDSLVTSCNKRIFSSYNTHKCNMCMYVGFARSSSRLQAHLVVGYHHVFSSSGSELLVNHEGTLGRA